MGHGRKISWGGTRAALAVAAFLCALVPGVALSRPVFRTVLASRNSQDAPADGDSSTEGTQLVSSDGRLVAFDSMSSNLPGGPTPEVYVRNIANGTTRLVSKTNSGQPAGGSVYTLGMTPDGRYVTLEGSGVGLPGSNGSPSEVWVRDLQTSRTLLVSRANNGDPANGASSNPWITPNGRYVEFESQASNLPGGDGTNTRIYVRDRKTGTTRLASITNAGTAATGNAYGQLLSSNGRFATFYSTDAALPGGDGTTEHVYRRDLTGRHTVLVDRTSGGQIADGGSRISAISGDGRYVAFQSAAANLPGGDGSDPQIYLRDMKSGSTILVSRNSAGIPQDGEAFTARISADDSEVIFDARASNLAGGPVSQVYIRNLATSRTRLVSRTRTNPGNADSYYPSISPNARWVTFDTLATNLGASAPHTAIVRAGPTG